MSRRSHLASLIAAERKTEWNSPNGKVPVKILRLHSKSARILTPDGERVVPVTELDLTPRWKSKYKPQIQPARWIG